MKMTPEQKDFLEYGKAIEKMNSSKKRLRGIWRSSENIIRRIGKASIIEPRHKENIKAAWQKRAACRAWVHPMRRRCSNCKHELTQYKFCAACVHEGWPVYWEPRKEGE